MADVSPRSICDCPTEGQPAPTQTPPWVLQFTSGERPQCGRGAGGGGRLQEPETWMRHWENLMAERPPHTSPAISDAAGVRWGTDEKTESSVQKWTGYMQAEAGLPKHDTRPGRRGGVEEGWLVSAQLFFRPQPPPRPPPAQH